jgi:hypothetical protein
MKKFKIYFLTILSSFVLAAIFGWANASIIIFFVIFFLQVVSEWVNKEKKKTKEQFLYYAGQMVSVAIGCVADAAISYLLSFVRM